VKRLRENETRSKDKISSRLHDIPVYSIICNCHLPIIQTLIQRVGKLDALDAFDDWWTYLV
jgi:hypothetical protein